VSEPWTIRLRRDSDFWEDTLTVTDELGAPVTFTDVSLIISPADDLPDVTWTIGNGITMPSAGVINFLVLAAVIATYQWSQASFRLRVVYTNGRVDGSFIKGVVQVL
jgi:hypothetical protein